MTDPVSGKLLKWYAENARDLPWRRSRDPYAIWVAEVMLQQTRVEAVIPYYQRWMQRFPDVTALADASQQEVLRTWEGLGYYGRARNLHRAAQHLVVANRGNLPSSIAELQRLPGVGRYTAAAIAAIAFEIDAVALDGNLRRVLARYTDLELDPRSPDGEQRLLAAADRLLPRGQASAFNQALMDLGASLCSPRAPACAACPLATGCLAYSQGTQEQRPVRGQRRVGPHHQVTAGVVHRDGKVLICRRPEDKLYGGLWEFPGGKQEPGETLAACLRRELREELGIEVHPGVSLGSFNHAFTHFSVTVHAFDCPAIGAQPQPLEHSEIRWVYPEELQQYPMGKVDREMARLLGGE